MDKVPISIDYKDKHYDCILGEVSGAAAMMWHLIIDNYYRGQLLFV